MDRGNVLIVDDEVAVRSTLRDYFGRYHEILTASSADEARVVLRREKVHVVVSDYKMPGQDGLSFLIETKKLFPGVVRVLMTAYADMNLVVRALNEGEIHRFVSKPYRFYEFRTILEDCLRLAGILEKPDGHGSREGLVLLAHDSQITLSTLRVALSHSYRLLSTSNGLDVLSFYGSNRIDAMVIGIGLELMDGCTITSYLKKEKKATLPIIIWSREISSHLEGHLRECGADIAIDEDRPDACQTLRDFLRDRIA